jgi:hypothetical protein
MSFPISYLNRKRVAVTDLCWTDEVVYTIDESRGSQVREDVLGEKFAEDATLSCDGWPVYRMYHTKLQRGWAHLLREAEFVAERYREVETLSSELHDFHEDLTAFDEEDPPAFARERRCRMRRCILRGYSERITKRRRCRT